MAQAPPTAPSLVELVASGVVDAELAALIWVLVEAQIPLLVAAPEGRTAPGARLLAGLLASIRPDVDVAALQAPMTAAAPRTGGVTAADGTETEVSGWLGLVATIEPLLPHTATGAETTA